MVGSTLLAFVVMTAGPAVTAQAPSTPSDAEDCLACHGDPELALDLPSGERRSLYVDLKPLAESVHRALRCGDCHPNMGEVPHPVGTIRNARELTLTLHEVCKRCHFANYTKTLDSVHAAQVARGDLRAPVCVDCHGAHDMMRPARPRSRISKTCARCHGTISEAYAKSVHGRSLLAEENVDVPVCTDCHRAHDIADPRVPKALLSTPELCGKCHADERVMKQYGLSTSVLNTYLEDFHGVTASLQRTGSRAPTKLAALCIDCHGVHDIKRVDEPGSRVIRANLLNVCQRCHPDATTNFPDAWLSHYDPSWQRAPLVYAARIFYAIFIPFVVGGLALQMLLHFWRVVVNR